MRRHVLLVVLLALAALAGATSARADDPPPEPVVPDGVTIAGLDVAGLTEAEAIAAVHARFARPIVLRFKERRPRVRPVRDLRSRVKAGVAARTALAAEAGKRVPLPVTIKPYYVRRYVNQLARKLDRAPKDSRLSLRNLRPFISKAKQGRRVLKAPLRAAIRKALRTHLRGPIAVPRKQLKPSLTRASFGPTIVIRRGSKRLYLYRGMRFKRSFGVATGLPQYPTPLGRFTIVTMQRHPWWYPPNAGWAAGAQPIPPGPGNPLGTRWMGLSVGAVGIHGTPNAASIGYSASHGCIRMRIPDAEALFERVRIGTTVFIVGV